MNLSSLEVISSKNGTSNTWVLQASMNSSILHSLAFSSLMAIASAVVPSGKLTVRVSTSA